MQKQPVKTTTIIGGKYRGKKLLLPPVITTRSSKNRLKESFFNTLQFQIVGKNFIEMFAGSGGVGLEALSRGAKKVYFFEYDKTAFATLKQNIDSMQPQKCEAIFGDSFTNIRLLIQRLQNQNEKAYFYIDPPFSIRQGMDDIYQKVIQTIESIPKEIVEWIVIEHMTQVAFANEIGDFTLQKSKKFGKTTLSYYEVKL
jgi:16S rRNA (guanine(966)-N(2))-methyltransferase RsmD